LLKIILVRLQIYQSWEIRVDWFAMALVVTWRMVQHRMHLSFCKYCDLWFVCLCISLSVSPRVYIRNYTCDLPNIWSCCLRLWRDLPPTRGGKSAIYDCLVYVVL